MPVNTFPYPSLAKARAVELSANNATAYVYVQGLGFQVTIKRKSGSRSPFAIFHNGVEV